MANEHQVRAQITGTVWSLEVESGQSVDEGATLMLLESMKMEIPVTAPAAGKVRLEVELTQTVSDGDLLATITD